MFFSVPFAYRYHAMPGDYYRFSPMAVIHLLESSGFSVCHIVSDGWRTLQATVFGYGVQDVDTSYFLSQDRTSLLRGASNYQVIAKRNLNTSKKPGRCNLSTKLNLTNEISRADLIRSSKYNWFPEPNYDFLQPVTCSEKHDPSI